jgi:alkylation response protein AidB-like acyl-CoA dehydrogenase
MNKPVSALSLQPSHPLDPRSPDLEALLSHIAEGASERERERILPYESIDLIRRARLGALRLPIEAGGAGSSIRELFEVVIRLGAADANVAHILRNHFSVVERLVRFPRDDQSRQWQKAVADGAIIGLATTELESPKVGDVKPNTTLTADGEVLQHRHAVFRLCAGAGGRHIRRNRGDADPGEAGGHRTGR